MATLETADQIPNRDLLFRYRLAGNSLKASLITERDSAGEGTFSLLLVPPAFSSNAPRGAIDVLAVIDPADAGANQQAVALLRCLSSQDTFRLFGEGIAGRFSDGAVAADAKHVDEACAALGAVGNGRAMSIAGVNAALATPEPPGRRRIVCLITDARGDQREALALVTARKGAADFLVMAASPAAERDSLDALARAGGGTVVDLSHGDPSGAALLRLLISLSEPAVTDLHLDTGGADVTDVLPNLPRNLYCGHPVCLVGKTHGSPPRAFTLTARVNNIPRSWTIPARPLSDLPGRTPLDGIWSRRKIIDLADAAMCRTDPHLDDEIRRLALNHGLMSRYTAFIVVDALSKNVDEAAAK